MKRSMKWLGAISVGAVVTTLVMCILAWGHTSPGEGVPWYGFGAGWMDPPRPGHAGQFRVSFVSGYGDSGEAVVRLHIPAGVELISGDSVRVGNPGRDGMRWEVRVRCESVAPCYIRGTMFYERGPLGTEEAEFTLPCSAVPESLGNLNSRTVRAEVFRNGQRYRYGGTYLVHIDSSERVVERDLTRSGSRAHVLTSSEVMTASLPASVQDTVNCVVFVKPDGSVRAFRVLGTKAVDASLRALIETELRTHWEFAPATVSGRPVDDWAEVSVLVRGE